jgi:mono/diheme cytochrome c family protein
MSLPVHKRQGLPGWSKGGREWIWKFTAILAVCAAAVPGAVLGKDVLPAGPHRDLVYGHCRTCHSLTYLTDSAGVDRSEWASVVDSMHQLGMPELTSEDRKKLLDYLATYLGPKPPPQAASSAAGGSAAGAPADGKTLFRQQCASCHQSDGTGVKGQFPPLANNPDLFLDREFPAVVALHGLEGNITVNGKDYDGQMPGFDYLSSSKLAAIISYVRSSWGNSQLRPSGMAGIDAQAVDDARKKDMTPAEVLQYRKHLGKAE